MKPIILDVECIVCNKSLHKINHNIKEMTRKMGKIFNRRSRTPNWSLEEKQFLLELIKERKDVVVRNNNGPNLSEEKDVAWNEIMRELLLKFGNKFDNSCIKKVKTQWQNMKRIAREEIALNGGKTEKYTRQSIEVCNILELMKDGDLTSEESFNHPTLTADVVIKTESVDEEMIQEDYNNINTIKSAFTTILQESQDEPNASTSMTQDQDTNIHDEVQNDSTTQSDSSICSVPYKIPEEIVIDRENEPVQQKDASMMTDTIQCFDKQYAFNPLHKELQDHFKSSAAEKELKIESLKEERQVFRAMRETAELNKIIAEQKLKHMLWVKNRELTFSSDQERCYSQMDFSNGLHKLDTKEKYPHCLQYFNKNVLG